MDLMESRDIAGDATPAQLRNYIVTHIDDAIDGGWIRPYYQPVVRTLTGKLCGVEALARWDDPTYGMLFPDTFIPALEDSRLIHLLDSSIVRQVCKQYRECVARGEATVPISFNLSRLDFDLCDIFSVVEKAAHDYGVPRHLLNIEITESVLGQDTALMISHMGKFHDAGYQVWMDDFGSGYSSLNILKYFDFDELKIDMEFLNRFGEKSKTILASVVDMAKKLEIQTLAEGVETDEHRTFLRRIGCEKMQGYLFGKPMPYDCDEFVELRDRIGIESTPERLYVSEIGAMNMLTLSERDLTAGNSTKDYVTSMSIATVEFSDGRFKVLDSNRVFREGLANVGITSVEEAERRINDQHRPVARNARELVNRIEETKFARLDYVIGDYACVMRARHITSRGGKIALLVSIDDTIKLGERRRHDSMFDMLSVMYDMYDHVDIIHLDEGYIEPVYGNIGLTKQFEVTEFDRVTELFAETEVYARDRERYMQFMDHDTMIERIDAGGENYITEFFRLRQSGGDYAWKMYILIRIPESPDAPDELDSLASFKLPKPPDRSGNQVMLCIRGVLNTHEVVLRARYDESFSEAAVGLIDDTPIMTDGGKWRALMRDNDINVFWKDRERRFVGANNSFLKYYGFTSVDQIIGKTDEDMGWHIDPAPYQKDEFRVLEEGEHIENAAGKCIVRGEVRDIIASKHPVYRGGRIVGLVGYFIDVEDKLGESGMLEELPVRDPITGVLNYTGLESATWRYVDMYQRHRVDFAMVSINIESFQAINKGFGPEFGEKVLRRIGDELSDIAGNQRVVGHVYADRFVILSQGESDEELKELCNEIEQRLIAIPQVDGMSCTIYALAGFSRFSELGDIEEMKRRNRDQRLERRKQWPGATDDGDVITSSLL